MKTFSFPKGVHPPDMKHLSGGKASSVLAPGKTAVVLLSQHTGTPAAPLLKKGERVLLGQLIGEADGLISAPVHAPVSGTVRAIEPHVSPAGSLSPAIIIDNDGRDEWLPDIHPPLPHWDSYSPDEVRKAVRNAGIVGLGGAAFPTAVKLTPPRGYPIDALIVNGAECEPYLTTDYRLMLEKSREIVDGAEIVRRTVGARTVYIAIEDNKPDAIALFGTLLRGRTDIRVTPLRTKYPQGGEKMLVRAVLRRIVPTGGLPFHVGALVQNVGTIVAIYQALAEGLPLLKRMITVSGAAVAEPKNLWVRIGTQIEDVITGCGGLRENAGRLIMGGPMMGVSQWSTAVPVIKATSGVLLLNGLTQPPHEYPCIRCNRCSRHCPMNLIPTRIANLVRIDAFDEAVAWGVTDCMECGTCAYVCPAAIPLVAWIRLGKYENLRRARKSGGSV